MIGENGRENRSEPRGNREAYFSRKALQLPQIGKSTISQSLS
jgi:hypothetical protein